MPRPGLRPPCPGDTAGRWEKNWKKWYKMEEIWYLPMNNGDLPMKNGDLPIKHGQLYLVGGIPTPLKNDGVKVSWGPMTL